MLSLGIGFDAAAVVAGLETYAGTESLMLVGHQPQLGELASFLLTGTQTLVPLPFKKGAVAAIEVDSLPPRVAGALLWFMSPKQLRALA
jgi:phosphohistidine phosphatase SixA